MNHITIDSYGFADGLIHSAAISDANRSSVIEADHPGAPLGPMEKWRWVDGEWVASIDRRGHSWYDPDNTDSVHNAAHPDDAPPDGWVYWEPGQNRVVSQAEAISKRWTEIRRRRDRLLSQSDWVVTKSMEAGQPVPVDWSAYRQGLRDITSQPDPFNLAWPLCPVSDTPDVFTVGAM